MRWSILAIPRAVFMWGIWFLPLGSRWEGIDLKTFRTLTTSDGLIDGERVEERVVLGGCHSVVLCGKTMCLKV